MLRLLKRTPNWCYRHWVLMYCTLLVVFVVILISCLHFMSIKLDDNLRLKESKFVPKTNKPLTGKIQESTTENLLRTMSYKGFDIDDEMENDNSNVYDALQKQTIKRLNAEQTIRNADKYGTLNNVSLIIVVQVHNRINYLNAIIGSLSRARDIENVLLIFSHDYYDPEINSLVRKIRFCKTLQIFFPYSWQVYKSVFPGRSAHDCPEHITRDKANALNCSNAKFPDQYGNYRNPIIAQTKHHWWWKVSTVFDRLEAVKNYSDLVLFIEEDHYMVKDFISTLKLMQRKCPQSKIFSLGCHANRIGFENIKVHLSLWISNLGMAFNRSVWNEFVECADKFCYYDDYNWDWSLQKMTKICPGHEFITATLQDSRIYHIGKCGTHHRNEDCSDVSHVNQLEQKLSSLKLYPKSVDVVAVPRNVAIGSGNGGWGDPRDQRLCMRMVTRHG